MDGQIFEIYPGQSLKDAKPKSDAETSETEEEWVVFDSRNNCMLADNLFINWAAELNAGINAKIVAMGNPADTTDEDEEEDDNDEK